MLIDDNLVNALQKIVNTELIKSIYPMIERIQITQNQNSILIVEIYVSDDMMTKENMYYRGLDPHYIIDFHIHNLFKYLGLKPSERIGFIVWGPKMNMIDHWVPSKLFSNER